MKTVALTLLSLFTVACSSVNSQFCGSTNMDQIKVYEIDILDQECLGYRLDGQPINGERNLIKALKNVKRVRLNYLVKGDCPNLISNLTKQKIDILEVNKVYSTPPMKLRQHDIAITRESLKN